MGPGQKRAQWTKGQEYTGQRGRLHEHNLNTVSGIGNAFGYAGGFVSLVLGAGISLVFGSRLGSSLTMRVVIFMSGLWWLGFSILPCAPSEEPAHALDAHTDARHVHTHVMRTVRRAHTHATRNAAAPLPSY